MSDLSIERKIEILSERISVERKSKFLHALNNRTRRLTVVLEDIFQPHNISAVMRSCDAFGIQDVHILESRYISEMSPQVDLGVSKWLDVYKYRTPEARGEKRGLKKMNELSETGVKNVQDTLNNLKSKGYVLAAATLQESAMSLDDIPLDKPLAIMIGTELTGLSQTAQNLSDVQFSFPMLGFAQSFNLSVFTAICLTSLTKRLRQNDIWKLSEIEKKELLLNWLSKSVSCADEILKLEI